MQGVNKIKNKLLFIIDKFHIVEDDIIVDRQTEKKRENMIMGVCLQDQSRIFSNVLY